jgi:hypothetical protein
MTRESKKKDPRTLKLRNVIITRIRLKKRTTCTMLLISMGGWRCRTLSIMVARLHDHGGSILSHLAFYDLTLTGSQNSYFNIYRDYRLITRRVCLLLTQ